MEELLGGLAGGAGWGLIAGIAIGAVARTVIRPVGSAIRPSGDVIRPAISGLVGATMAAGDRLGQWGAQAREQLDDIVAEARAERAASAATRPASEPAK